MEFVEVDAPKQARDRCVLYAKLPSELVEYLAATGASSNLKIKFGKDHNILTADEREYTFRNDPELVSHHCYIQQGGAWNKVGSIKTQVFFDPILNAEKRDEIKRKTREADEKKRSEHASKVLDPSEEPIKRRGKKNVFKTKSTVLSKSMSRNNSKEVDKSTLSPVGVPAGVPVTSTSISTTPASTASVPQKSYKLTGPELRKHLIQVLALKSHSSAAIDSKFKGIASNNEVVSTLQIVAVFKHNSWTLKSDLFKEVDHNWEFYSEEEKVKLSKHIQLLKEKEAKRDTSPPKQTKQSADESTSHQADSLPSKDHVSSMIISNSNDSNVPKSKIEKKEKKEKREKRKSAGTLIIETDKIVETPSKKQRISPTSQDTPTIDTKEIPKELSKKSFKKNALKPSNTEQIPAGNQSTPASIAKDPTKKDKTKLDNGSLSTKKSAKNEAKQKSDAIFSFPRSLLLKNDVKGQPKSKPKKTQHDSAGKASGPISSHDEYLSYKSEFDKRYAEYTSLRSQIESTQKQFEQLGEQWKKASTLQEKEELDSKITTLYNENCEKVHTMKERHNQLHHQLQEIKKKVKEASSRFGLHITNSTTTAKT